MNTMNAQKKEWDTSADLVRITAMLMVVILHVARMSGFLNISYDQDAAAKWISNVWEAPTIIAVNLFALLTGYLCVDKKWKVKRIFSLWVQAAFYVLAIAGVYAFAGHKVSLFRMALALFPLTSSYWYVIAYSALFLLIPFMNRGLQALNRRDGFMLCAILVLTLSVFGFASPDALAARGHCVLWLGVMYICGACLKLHYSESNSLSEISNAIGKGTQHVGFKRVIILSIFVVCCLLGCLTLWKGGECEKLLFRHYQSPIVCMESITCFYIIIHFRIKAAWLCSLLRWLSPMSFGVYLFHYGMWRALAYLLTNLAEETNYPWWFIPVFSIVIYAFGTIVDFIRIKLFQLCRIPNLCQYMSTKMPTCIKQMEKW